jgi:hypothetical protein
MRRHRTVDLSDPTSASRNMLPRTRGSVLKSTGALALGACAIGALAIGALAIGRLAIGRARIGRLEIDELVVRKLSVVDELDTPPKSDPEQRTD